MLNNPFGIMLWAKARIGCTHEEIPDIPRRKFMENWRLPATARGQGSHRSLLKKWPQDKQLLTLRYKISFLSVSVTSANIHTVRCRVFANIFCGCSFRFKMMTGLISFDLV